MRDIQAIRQAVYDKAIQLRDFAINSDLNCDEVVDVVNQIRELPACGSVGFVMQIDEISNEVCDYYNNLRGWSLS